MNANILTDHATVEELAAFNGTRVTLGHKAIYQNKYPLDPPRIRIQRPQSTAVDFKQGDIT